jgi:transcriptional regulator with XRE-family HTH domain
MKQLKELKKKHGLSMLILAHTPKRDLTRPLTVNDIQGSKMVANFMDSAFAIGASTKGPTIRYIKQIKQRNTEPIYHAYNVCVCEIVNPGNFVQFRFSTYGEEWVHLREKNREEIIAKAKELDKNGLTQRQIAEELDISPGSVNNYLRKK